MINAVAASDQDPRSLPLDSLANLCAQQTAHFYQGRESDTSYCFEIFRRAILKIDPFAWEYIQQVYSDQIVRWVRRHPAFVATGEEEAYFLNRALENFWQAVTADRFGQFPDLKHVLSYLQLCVFSVITDTIR